MFLTDAEYNHVTGLLNGTISPTPLLQELSAWTKENFQVDIYDYCCDSTVNGLTRMRVVVRDYKAQDFMKDGVNYNPKIQRRFQEKFAELARKYGVHPEYHNADDIFVCCETVRDQIAGKTLWQARDQIYALKTGDIWKIEIIFSSVHIFYETDEQVERHSEDGTSELLRQKISSIVKYYDRYEAFESGVSCVFTSHQTLDEKYKGSMFYYTR